MEFDSKLFSNNNKLTIIGALRQFTASELLTASNAYECENCCAKKVNERVSFISIIFFYKVVF